MAPTVARAKTAFQFFQADKLADIKKELGGSMGAAMTEVSGLKILPTQGVQHAFFYTYDSNI